MIQTMETITYRILIELDERGTFHGYAPALPGCHTWGKSISETRRHLRDAMQAYLKSLIADGMPIPSDAGFESIETLSLKDLRPGKRAPSHV